MILPKLTDSKRTVIKNTISTPRETILVDDRIYNQYAAIESGAHPVRMRCEFTTDSPTELSWIPEFANIEEVKDWLVKKLIFYP